MVSIDNTKAGVGGFKFEDFLFGYLKEVKGPLTKACAAKSVEEFEEGIKKVEEITKKFVSDVITEADLDADFKEEFGNGRMVQHFESLRSIAKKDLEAAELLAEFTLGAIEEECNEWETEVEDGEEGEDLTREAG